METSIAKATEPENLDAHHRGVNTVLCIGSNAIRSAIVNAVNYYALAVLITLRVRYGLLAGPVVVRVVPAKLASKFELEYVESLVHKGNPTAGLSVFDYLCTYLNRAKSSIQINTYESYHGMISEKSGDVLSLRQADS